MHAHNRPLSFFSRSLLVLALAVSATAIAAELRAAAFSSSETETSSSEARRATASANGSAKRTMPTYRWNLADSELPLISLPEQINGGLDLSLTYSLDQFEFPLFQSLYYNQRAGKYILMVIPKDGGSGQANNAGELPTRRAEFIDLEPVNGRGQFEVNGKPGLRLTDKGSIKLLSTSDGTIYTFALLRDGELHCSQIRDRAGVVLDLKYTDDSSIETIADALGRSVRFGYTDHYVSAITQTWIVDSAKLRKTWAIADEVRFAHKPAASAVPIGVEAGKHIPSNATKPIYTRAMSDSDAALAALFGGTGAIAAANGFEPAGLGNHYPLYRGDLTGDDGQILRGHLSFAMHLYGSADGTSETEVYVPAGFTSHSNEPTPTDAVVTFYYPRLGNLSNVTLAVFHVANFQLIPEAGRVRIGNIGGRGGSASSYRHSHLEFYRGDTGLPTLAAREQLRIDPACVFTTTAETN